MRLTYVFFLILLILCFPTYAQNHESEDTANNRVLLKIPYEDRDDLLHVMRNNLNNLGKMIEAMANNDYASVQEIAEKMSFNKKKGKGLAHRGNKAFTAMGLQFHAVDTIAVMKAAQKKNSKTTLQSMAKMVNTCVACHSTFRVTEWPADKAYNEGVKITV